jgi:NADH-quinone oxidoreductase subunit H
MSALGHVVIVLAVALGALGMAAAMIWIERKALALWQDRRGPNRVGPMGAFQVVADMIKIFTKENWIPPFADKAVFVLAPCIVLASTLMALAVVVFAPGWGVVRLNIGVLFFLAASSLGGYAVVLAGWASNSKYSLLGALRGAAQTLSYEVFLALAVMGVVVQAGSFDIGDIIAAQRELWFIVPQFVGFVAFLIGGFGLTHRLPLDLPESENELVAGFHTEYSGMKFAMFFLGEYLGIIVVSAMVVTLYLGGWQGPGASAQSLPGMLAALAWFLGKMLCFMLFFILMRASMPRPRYDQLMGFAWKVMLPLSLANLLATAWLVLAAEGAQ